MKLRNLNNGLMTCAAALIAVAATSVAEAQEATDQPSATPENAAAASQPETQGASADERGGIDRVVVTANRRESDLQDTAVSVSAVTDDLILDLQPRNVGELSSVVPNFSAGQASVNRAASFAIRGVAQNESNIYMDQPVGVVVDDFVMPSTMSQLFDMFDIERVEVLRGPQGTLFGKNTTGGVISVVTKRPEMSEMSGQFQVAAGSWDTREARAALNIPVIDDVLAVRAVGSFTYDDGYYTNSGCWGPFANVPASMAQGCGNGERVGGRNVTDFRLKALWTPSDTVSVFLQYMNGKDRSEVSPIINITPPGNLWAVNRIGYPANSGDPIDNAVVYPIPDRLINSTAGTRVDLETYLGTVDWDTFGGTITATTGFQTQSSYLPSPWGTSVPLNDSVRADNQETFQQEVRYASDWDGPVQIVAGLFYQQRSVDFCTSRLLGLQDVLGATSPYGAFRDNPQITCNQQDQDSTAAFLDATWDVTDRLTIGAGYRQTEESKDWAGRPLQFVQSLTGTANPAFTWRQLGSLMSAGDFNLYPGASGVSRNSKSWSEPTYRLNVSYDITDDTMVYGTYARGFRSGAYNDSTGSAGVITALSMAPTDPEIATNTEIGIKTEFWDNRARINLAAFSVDYEGMQRSLSAQLPGPNSTTLVQVRYFNAAEANVQGLELEATLVPIDPLELRLTAGVLDGGYDSFLVDSNSDGTIDTDFTSRDMNNAPPLSYSLSATYTFDLEDGSEIRLNGTFEHKDETLSVYSQIAPIYDTILDERDLVNLTLRWANPDDTVSVQLVGRNLTDERYKTWAIPAGSTAVIGGYAQPRYIGVLLDYRF